jgi:hypothetical protein
MNVWLLVIEKRITQNVEHVLGPFTAVAIEDDRIIDSLTGQTILRRRDPEGYWYDGDGRTGKFDRVVIQQGGFESPWGDRGK